MSYEHHKKHAAELQRAKEELQILTSKLTAEKEVLNLNVIKLENTVSALNDKADEQTRMFNQM